MLSSLTALKAWDGTKYKFFLNGKRDRFAKCNFLAENTCKLAVCPWGPRWGSSQPSAKELRSRVSTLEIPANSPALPLGTKITSPGGTSPLHFPPTLRDEDVAKLLLGFNTFYMENLGWNNRWRSILVCVTFYKKDWSVSIFGATARFMSRASSLQVSA